MKFEKFIYKFQIKENNHPLGEVFNPENDWFEDYKDDTGIIYRSLKWPHMIIRTENGKIRKKFFKLENNIVEIGKLKFDKSFVGQAEKANNLELLTDDKWERRLILCYVDSILIAVIAETSIDLI